MVKRTLVVLIALFTLTLVVSAISSVNAQNLVYSVDHQWAQIFINQDGTIDLTYNITVTVTSGSMGGFYVGQPNSDFTAGIPAAAYEQVKKDFSSLFKEPKEKVFLRIDQDWLAGVLSEKDG